MRKKIKKKPGLRKKVEMAMRKPVATPAQDLMNSRVQRRHISLRSRYFVWRKYDGKCSQCKTSDNLNFDHIVSIGIGGKSELENLRLLCFDCNQRGAMTMFGVEKIKKAATEMSRPNLM